jgi:hypothetical protein
MPVASPLMLSSGPINAQVGAGQIAYSGVPSVQTPASIVQASITSQTTVTTNVFPLDLDTSRYPSVTLAVQQFSSFNPFQNVVKTSGGTNYVFPLPRTLEDLHEVDFQVQGLFDEVKQLAGGVLNGALNTFGAIADVAGAVGGFSINQFQVVLLKGPKYKSFQFDWAFSPRNVNESNALQQIIVALQDATSPVMGQGNFYFDYPKIFQISFTNLGDRMMLYNFLPAVCIACDVKYGGDGNLNTFYRPSGSNGGHAPAIIELSMKFLEMEYWTQGMYTSTGSVGNPTVASAADTFNNAVNAVGAAANTGLQAGKSVASGVTGAAFSRFTGSGN